MIFDEKLLIFDWYSATVLEDNNSFRERFSNYQFENLYKGNHGYANSGYFHITDQDKLLVRWNMLDSPMPLNIVSTGGFGSSFLPEFLRSQDIPHRVTRADIALDISGDYLSIVDACRAFAFRKDLKTNSIGDWDRGIEGRTYYIGSMKSNCFIRIYEKGKEMQSKGFKDFDLNHVRIEIVVKPNHVKEKEWASKASPMEMLGLSPWAIELIQEVFKLKVERVNLNLVRNSDLDISLTHMLKQYRKLIVAKIEELGGVFYFIRWCISKIKEIDAEDASKGYYKF